MVYSTYQERTLSQAVNASTIIRASLATNALCIDQAIFIAPFACVVSEVYYTHATAGDHASAVNVQLTRDTATAAPGAGTDLLTNNTNAGFDCKGTANTVQTGTLVTAEATRTLAAGDRLSLDFAGNVQTLAGVVLTVVLRQV